LTCCVATHTRRPWSTPAVGAIGAKRPARLLGWGRNTLTRKLKALRLDPNTPTVEDAEVL